MAHPPTTASTLYTGPIRVTATETIQAIAVATDFSPSPVASIYTINLPAATPAFTPTPSTYNATQSIVISDTTPGATIYYTLDGSTPTTSSTVYTTPIAVKASETIQAIATAPGFSTSAVGSATYVINLPNFTIAINPGAVTVTAGGQALTNVTVTGLNGFASAVSFACSGLPTGATCAFNPVTVAPNGAYTVTTVLAINTAATTAALHKDSNPLLPTTALALTLCLFLGRRRRALKIALMLAVCFLGANLMTGCSGTNATTRTATTSTVTVTATAGTLQKSSSPTLTVQ